jgi:triacylglycerol esterase/lipase EstA (alpha/beta hydrolase family)
MVARLQQVIVLAWLALAAGWLGYWWNRSVTVACTGIVALASVHAAVLAIEFIASCAINKHDAAPRARVLQYLRAWLAESCMAPRVFCWRQPFRSQAQPDRLPGNGLRGVVLIHGFLCNRGFWTPWLRELTRRERPFIALSLEPALGSIDNYVRAIDDAIARIAATTGLPPVLVCHSMGGLAARAWLRDADDASRVHRIVTMGTPHAGTWLARFAQTRNGREMRRGGEWLTRSVPRSGGALRVAFTCWYSNCDNIVFPASSATLPGADNRLAAGLAHVEMAFDRGVMRETLALLDAQ